MRSKSARRTVRQQPSRQMSVSKVEKTTQTRDQEGDTTKLHLLIFTRSPSFDYQWVYGHEDKAFENVLHQHLLNWISPSLLSKLPPATTFFQLRGYCALMLAQVSDTRFDSYKRPIFQEALFVWEPTEKLYYRHLEPLATQLAEAAEEVYAELPDNVLRYTTRVRHFDLDTAALDKEAANLQLGKLSWELPGRLTWNDVTRYGLTVEAPKHWGFDKMVAALGDQPLSKQKLICVAHSLHAENRFASGGGWLVSAKEPSEDQEAVRILKTDGHPLQPSELSQLTEKPANEAGGLQPRASGPTEAERTQPRDESKTNQGEGSQTSTRQEERKAGTKGAESKEQTGHAVSPNPAEVEEIFRAFSKTKLYQTRAGRVELSGLFKRFLERDYLSILDTEARILTLLTPAGQALPSDIIVAWNYLLNEILLSYQHPSPGMLSIWLRRLDDLRYITTKNMSRREPNWGIEFEEACNNLRTLLQEMK
jgi:hypothetical protein